MTTYRELIARRDDFEFMSVSWKGVNSLIQEYLKAQIIAGHMEFARMVIGDLYDATESGLTTMTRISRACMTNGSVGLSFGDTVNRLTNLPILSTNLHDRVEEIDGCTLLYQQRNET